MRGCLASRCSSWPSPSGAWPPRRAPSVAAPTREAGWRGAAWTAAGSPRGETPGSSSSASGWTRGPARNCERENYETLKAINSVLTYATCPVGSRKGFGWHQGHSYVTEYTSNTKTQFPHSSQLNDHIGHSVNFSISIQLFIHSFKRFCSEFLRTF